MVTPADGPRLINMFRHRADLSVHEFREYYETKHVPLILANLGHLMTAYTRSYVDRAATEVLPASLQGGFDVVTEIEFVDMEAMQEMFRLSSAGDLGRLIAEDENRFMDPVRHIVVSTERCQTPVS